MRRLVAWWTGRLYLHPPKRARQMARYWLWFAGAAIAVWIGLRLVHSWAAPLVGWFGLAGFWNSLRQAAWADGWEARDWRGEQ